MIGKLPVFEVRQMDAEHHEPLKVTPILRGSYPEESELTINEDKSAEMESDEDSEDEDYASNQFKNRSIKRSVRKPSPPVCVYTYRVNCRKLLYSIYVLH